MATVLITGTNRGIGLEFVKQIIQRGDTVLATCRDLSAATELQALAGENATLELLQLDVANAASLQAFPGQLNGRAIDIFINNAGVYGPRTTQFGELEGESWGSVFEVNASAPMLLTQLLMDNLGKGADKKLVYVTSKMGSMGDNSGGGSYVYRSSKAALNAAVKSLAVDLGKQGFAAGLLHPGWVQTDMGGPNALIDTKTSVDGMLQVIDDLSMQTSGGFFNYDGSTIPW